MNKSSKREKDIKSQKRSQIINLLIVDSFRMDMSDIAFKAASSGEASPEIIEEKFMEELRTEIGRLKKPLDPPNYPRCVNDKKPVMNKIVIIAEILCRYDIHPYALIDVAVVYSLEYGFYYRMPDLVKFASKPARNKAVKTCIGRGDYRMAEDIKGDKLNLDELDKLLDRFESGIFEKVKEMPRMLGNNL